jgi:prepilin-type N-terminal cleavage/methylation domain-containing protein
VIRKAYTLIELLVAMGIMGLLLTVGIPSFSGFNNSINFKDKVDEVNSLINQTYLMSRNPDSLSTVQYQVSVDVDDSTKLNLSNCIEVDAVSGLCINDNVIKTVTLSAGEEFQAGTFGLGESYIVCPTNLEKSCVIGSNPVTFSIMDSRVSKQADFTAETGPFKVKTEISVVN